MLPSSFDNDNNKLNLMEKENNLFSQEDNYLPNSPIFLDNNRGNSDKLLNYFYTNTPYSSISEEILDKCDFKNNLINPMPRYIINNEKNKKVSEHNNSESEDNELKIDGKKTENKNEEVQFIILDNSKDLDQIKNSNISSYGCLNSTSNNDKKIKNLNQSEYFNAKKIEKKRDLLLLNQNADIIGQNKLHEDDNKSLMKKNNLNNNSFVDLNEKIKNINYNKNNLLKIKRKRKTNEDKKTVKANTNLLFDNDNLKENIIDNDQIKKNLSLKDKCKNLKKIKIPKIIPSENIYPYIRPHIQMSNSDSVIHINNYNIDKKKYNSKKYNSKKNKNIENENYINNINLKDNYKSDFDLSNMQNENLESDKEEKQEKLFMPQIFESQAPPIIINGIEYTTVLMPKVYLKKIKFDFI